MNSKQRKILRAIFQNPLSSSIRWVDIESLFMALGGQKKEGNGSRVRFYLNGVVATFHRPHPQSETDKGALVSVRRFLIEGGIKNENDI